MRLLAYSFLISFALGEQLVIDAVDSAVAQQVAKFKAYIDYSGPTEAETATASSNATHAASPKVKVNHGVPKEKLGTPYWYEAITHQGKAAFNTNATYNVFRNVMTYGAVGDGVTDDTAAIQKAISDGNRCAPGSCASSTIYPAVVYFPAGTYLISSSLIDYYNTQLHGNPNSLPTLKATRSFTGLGLIDGNKYISGNTMGFQSSNIFYRQVRNFIIDMTSIPASSPATGIHWPTGQATSLQNIIFNMSMNSGTKHQGLFIEAGSGGFMNDLVFYGGLYGAVLGNQQFTVRNLTFYNAITAINQIWNWGFTYKSLNVINCSLGLDMTNGEANPETVNSITMLDSFFTNTSVAIKTNHRQFLTLPLVGNSLAIENTFLTNVPVAIQLGTTNATLLTGTTSTAYLGNPSINLTGYGAGNLYNPSFLSYTNPFRVYPRPASLITASGSYYERSKPQYNNLTSTSFSSVRSGGAAGDGVTDDTTAIQNVINAALGAGNVVFFDYGTYKVTKTIFIPAGSRIVGEGYSVILGTGTGFGTSVSGSAQTIPIVQVGNPGDTGIVEWSDMIVSTQGSTQSGIVIQWNLASPAATPSGMWDVHTRIGGFIGSNLQKAQCIATPSTTITAAPAGCVTAFLNMWITPSASGLYMENVWLWTADHDLDDPSLAQISVFTGRGLLISSSTGTIWLSAFASDHHQRYQIQLLNTINIYMGMIKTESPYYQPNPYPGSPYGANNTLPFFDPFYNLAGGAYCNSTSYGTIGGECGIALGLRIQNSSHINIFGAGLYALYNNYSSACNKPNAAVPCANMAASYDASVSQHLLMYGFNTVGFYRMLFGDLNTISTASNNTGVYPSVFFYYRAYNPDGTFP